MEVRMDELIVTSERLGCIFNGWKEETFLYVCALSRKIIRSTDTESSLTSLVDRQRRLAMALYLLLLPTNQLHYGRRTPRAQCAIPVFPWED